MISKTAEEWQAELMFRVRERMLRAQGCQLCGEPFEIVHGYAQCAEMALSRNVDTVLDGRHVTLAAGSVVRVHHEPCAYGHQIA